MVSTEDVALSPLKLLRLHRGWSQDEVVLRVREAGGRTDRAELSRLERRLQVITSAKAEQLAAAFGVGPQDVLGEVPS